MPAKIMYNILSQCKINFETEKTFDWCRYIYKNKLRTGRYDFYFTINEKEYIIEMDGGWHSSDNILSGQTKEDSEYIDTQKDILAQDHNIEVIRVDCAKSSIKNIKTKIINSKVSNILNIANINWEDCYKYLLSSNIITACNLFNSGKSLREISNIMHKHVDTVGNYLIKGNIAGYCIYDSKENNRRAVKKANEKHRKSIVCIETNEFFYSIADAERYYHTQAISQALRYCKNSAGKLPDGTKLHWRYATPEEIILHEGRVKNN